MTNKPLKTVDSIFNWQTQLLIREGITQSTSDTKKLNITQEIVDKAKAQAKADLYQLMLSLKPHKKNIDYRDGYKGNKVNEARSEGYNQAIADFQAKLSEHFNGEGEQ